MKRNLALCVLFSVLAATSSEGSSIPNGPYFGQTPPGFTPQVFAPGVISLPTRFEYCVVFSPALDECVFGLTNASWGGFALLYTQMAGDGSWIDPIPAPFLGSGDGCYPSFSTDGQEVCFASSRPNYPPMRIWSAERDGAVWGAPVALDAPVFSGANEWGSSMTSDGTLYFCSDRAGGLGAGDIYRAVTGSDGTVTVENVGAPISSPQLEGAPRIAPDESWLIFESQRPGGYGQSDLYISFRQGGVWSTPRNLGAAINTTKIEDGPFVSPDGKYFFFNRRKAGYTSEQSELWWVDARAVFDPAQSDVRDGGSPFDGGSLLRVEPNPFARSTTLRYAVPSAGHVSIRVFDVLGREVQSLVNASRGVGTYDAALRITRESDSAGLYFCRVELDGRPIGSSRAIAIR